MLDCLYDANKYRICFAREPLYHVQVLPLWVASSPGSATEKARYKSCRCLLYALHNALRRTYLRSRAWSRLKWDRRTCAL